MVFVVVDDGVVSGNGFIVSRICVTLAGLFALTFGFPVNINSLPVDRYC